MKYFTLFVFCLCLYACGNSGTSSAAVPQTIDGANYLVEQLPGSTTQLVSQQDASGEVIETGQMINGLKTGTWLTFNPEKKAFPTTLTTYVDGIKNGPYFEFNDRGQIDLTANFKNDQYHGYYAKYRFSRPEETREYKDGQLHGVHRKYFQRDGKIQQEMTYANGQLEGPYRFYNEEGAITVEYMYKNNEKVSGGIINPSQDNTPK